MRLYPQNSFQDGKLLKDIIPDDQRNKRNPEYYAADSRIEITPHGVYVHDGDGLQGWLYKNLKTKVLHQLQENVDYVLT